MKETPGSVTGTKIIVFEGGPPEWAGVISGVSKTGGGRAERWCHVADEAVVYLATDRMQSVRISHHRKGGIVEKEHQAQVYEFAGYRDELED